MLLKKILKRIRKSNTKIHDGLKARLYTLNKKTPMLQMNLKQL